MLDLVKGNRYRNTKAFVEQEYVYLVETRKRKVVLKRTLDAVDSFSVSLEHFCKFYVGA